MGSVIDKNIEKKKLIKNGYKKMNRVKYLQNNSTIKLLIKSRVFLNF